ncbi:MAG TPA: alpha/beta fold hydrolase [Pseudonocardiaceae bacterium]|jgi:pimeloyl-ACP methyl ester carboxylesterase|nr:alpha/beta fold hydrolase [Pseudonocardiaceae bacterium]
MARTVRTHGLVLVEHEFRIPLDHRRPDGERITVFAREVADPDGRDRPLLVFLNGGPGFEASRPTRNPTAPGWLDRALRDYRVLMLDQRGTGRSTPVGALPGMTPRQQADHLTHFRADSIVADAEWIRGELGVDTWAVLGQSFGGFCALHYLSVAPHALRAAYFTGGLPPIRRHPDEIYAATYARTLERNRRYYQRYPQDRALVAALCEKLDTEDVRLPTGDRLTSRRLRQAGNMLGMSDGFEELHYLLELPVDSPAFLHDAVAKVMSFARNPIYWALHESSYSDGYATNWSAQRVLPEEFNTDSTLFTAEHVYPWMGEDFGGLAPLRAAADLLAAQDWPRLYDADVLRHNEVPCAAAVYAEDLFVESAFSMETAATVRGLRPWLTNEYEHSGLRVSGGRVLDRLIDLAAGRS